MQVMESKLGEDVDHQMTALQMCAGALAEEREQRDDPIGTAPYDLMKNVKKWVRRC